MRKWIALTLAMLLVLMLPAYTCAWALAETPVHQNEYELSEDDTVVTVRLPANETTGYSWDFEISDPSLLELVTCEYVPDEAPEGMMGVGGYWAGSFRCSGTAQEGQGGRVRLTLNYTRPSDPKTVEPAAGYALDIWVIENGQLQVDGIWTLTPVTTE